ncbi:hypothetical protein ILUMI_21884 [Ignelater luminosus]|uniref:MMS19 nucleotide excision repair protein n=1 Tax=Ignelater luminosus TaxID=2038154 RepID=A0A8K0G112_IGNLU|nr:hypothetical protein ILUMI_21884 [Ignelater luminosus]
MDIDNNSLIEDFRSLNKYDTEFSKKCKKISHDLQSGGLTMVQLVEQLKDLLISPIPDSRELGMLILSQVLESLSENQLAASQLNFICAFYSDRLNDHHQVIPPTLRGVLALMRFENVPEGATKQILSSLFQNVPCQQQQQADRHNIYKLLEICLDRRNTEVHEMGVDFIYGVISAMDGERDPRNLLYLFNWLPKFLKSFTFDHLTEEMFEVMACYFPVDFRAPTQDPNSISREALATSLSTCLCAIPEFAEYCFPLILEKLSSSLRIAKLDSLNILAEGCKTFEVPFYIQHSTDIWSQIQREVLNSNDRELEEIALKTLEIVVNKLSYSADDVFKRILCDITDTLKGNLLPHMKLFVPSCKILYHVAKASKSSADYVTFEVVPMLVNTYNITMTTSHQVMVFKNLISFVRVYIDVHGNDDVTQIEQLNVIPNLCLKASLHKEDEMRSASFQNLSLLTKSLPIETRKCLYENIRVLLVVQRSDLMNDSFLKCFKAMAQTYSEEIQNYVLKDIKINDLESLKVYLDSLIVITDQEEFTEFVLSIFIQNSLKDINTAQITTGYFGKLLECYKDNRKIQEFLVQKEEIINKLISWTLNHLNEINISKNLLLLENISQICKLIIGYQDSDSQHKIIDSELERIIILYRNSHNYLLLIIFDGLLTRLRKDVQFEHDILDDLLNAALNITEDNVLQQTVFELLANILNKTADDTRLENNLKNIINTCNFALDDSNNEHVQRNVVNIISWVTKAVVMRGHKMSEVFVNKLLELLETKFAPYAAKGLKIVMNDNCASLDSESYCNRRLLYRQKFFIEVSSKLIENYKEENSSYLLAIGYLLQGAPKQVFILQFTKILRLVILCLEQCENAEVLGAVLDTLCNLIQNKEYLIEEYIQEFLPRLLKLATFKPAMQVRMKALHCLQYYTQGYPIYKLIPHKQNIIYGLTQCLDDKKRLVRKEAVEARLRWFLLDAPT